MSGNNPVKLADSLFNVPMPKYDGAEPDAVDLTRIMLLVDQDRFGELSKDEQRWVTRRLMPSLMRYGCYPPPKESTTGVQS